MDAGKFPESWGWDRPVKCEFCYELDHSYRENVDPPKTSDEDRKFIPQYISRKPTDPRSSGALAATSSWNGPTFPPPQGDGMGRGLSEVHRQKHPVFTVGFVHVPKIHQLVAQYPGRINFELRYHAQRVPAA